MFQRVQLRGYWPQGFVAVAGAALLARIGWMTWVSDDAFITLRTVDNLVSGFGARWNVAERVQSYTHPLWMLWLSAVHWFVRDGYFTAVVASLTVSAAAVALLARKVARTPVQAVGALLVLLASRAFVDFSTSGLENPLSHLLLGAFVVTYLASRGSLMLLTLWLSLLATNRTDASLLVAPAWLAACFEDARRTSWRNSLRQVLTGMIPLGAWELFSVVYYGFPFPNTAYAKLGTGISPAALSRQGWVYLGQCLRWDPVSLLSIGAAVAWSLRSGVRHRMLAVGVLLYLVYVVRIGGDFMVGRFITLPLWLSVAILASAEDDLRGWRAFAVSAAPLLAAMIPGLASGVKSGTGILDERAYYEKATSIRRYRAATGLPKHGWVRDGLAFKAAGPSVQVIASAGFVGYFAGPEVHLVDLYGLVDPLIARLPTKHQTDFRIGHFVRRIPPHYVEVLEGKPCAMKAPLCDYYAKLETVVRGPLLSWDRAKLIVQLNTGQLDDELNAVREVNTLHSRRR